MDDMKLQSDLYWNSQIHKFICFAGNTENSLDLGSELKDLLKPNNNVSYDDPDGSNESTYVNLWKS